jgi:copper(I)-binding protein
MIQRQLQYGLCVLLLALAAVSPAHAETDLRISNAWIREAPPGSHVLAGYLTIENAGTAAVTVAGISGDDFSSIEIHRTVIEDGMARMLSIGQLDIPAGNAFILEPGGYHLMLFNPRRTLTSGDSVELLLHVADGPCLPVNATVLRKRTD